MFRLAAKEFGLFLLQSAKVSMMSSTSEMAGQEFLQGNRTFQSHAEQRRQLIVQIAGAVY